MSYQEWRAIVSGISTLLITGVYAAYRLEYLPAWDAYTPEVFHFWGSFFLLLIPVSIVAKIIIYILFSIAHAVATREEETPITDERDKMIELKAMRNSSYSFGIGVILGMVALVMGMPPSALFVALILSGVISEVVSDLSSFYFYRRGV